MLKPPPTIFGSVKDAAGEVVIGATVLVKGTTNGVSTDMEGKFSLSVSNPKQAILQVTFLGYEPYETSLSSRSNIDVVLKESVSEIDEVMVVAYGVQKKETLTGAISSVSTEDLLKSPNSSIANSLAGKITGFSSVQKSGQPGLEDPDIYIRGAGSLSEDGSRPLILVDGVERDFFQMDPNEIETFSVLKDASATAVFGVRGANGVILITTRRGKEGTASITVRSSVGVQTPTRTLKSADSHTYATMHNEMSVNDGRDPIFDDYALDRFRLGDEPVMYPNINWIDYMTNDLAVTTQHNLTVSGGTKKVRYFVSLGYLYQDGLFKDFGMEGNGFDYSRYNYRTNLDVDVTSSTKLSIGIGGIIGSRNEPIAGRDLWVRMNWAQPFASAGIVDDKYMPSKPRFSTVKYEDPLGVYYGKGYRSDLKNTMNMDVSLNQNLDFITKGLSIGVKGAYNTNVTHEKKRSASVEKYVPNYESELTPGDSHLDVTDPMFNKNIVYDISGTNTKLNFNDKTSSRARDWYAEFALRYNRKFGDHNVTALALYNQDKTYYPGKFSYLPSAYVGFVGRVTYDYKNRYMAEFNIGYNGSENFAPDQRYGTFPAASVGYIISEEPFMKRQKAISFLKLRASAGFVGNDNMNGARYLYQPSLYSVNLLGGKHSNWGNYPNGYNFGYNNEEWHLGAQEGKLGNPNVTWETVLKQNYGIDIHLFESRLKFTADYFMDSREDILITRNTVPGLSGLTSSVLPVVNMGIVENKGFELDVTWSDNVGQDFSYSINGNVSHSRNEIIFQDEITPNEDYMWRTGLPSGTLFGYVASGLYDESHFTDGNLNSDLPNPNASVAPGDIMYQDLNSDGEINSDDITNIGFPTRPEYIFGLNIDLFYKGFTLGMNWTGATNRSLHLEEDFRIPFNGEDRGLMQFHADNRWTSATANTAKYPRLTYSSQGNNAQNSSLWIEDGSYIKLKNLSFGYKFYDKSWLKKVGVGSFEIVFTGYNLLTFDKFKIMDPESSPDQWGHTYPVVKIYNLGVNITF